MLDVEISMRLAVAIGYKYTQISVKNSHVYVNYRCDKSGISTRIFSYKDPTVIWKIAERYDAFPTRTPKKHQVLGHWCALTGNDASLVRYADTPEKAIAMCMIAKHEHDKRLKFPTTRRKAIH